MKSDASIVHITADSRSKANCSQCSLNSLCLPLGLNQSEIEKLDGLVNSDIKLKPNETVFEQGQKFTKLFAIRSGVFKSAQIDSEGNEKILGFYLPGELVGLDAIHEETYKTNVTALDTASVCSIPFDNLTNLTASIPSLQLQLLRMLSKEINDVHTQILNFGIEQRLAAFIYTLSLRYQERGYSGTHINLAMPRLDIANHLNMAPETISRLFKRMQADGLININRRELIITDMQKLKDLAGCIPGQE